MTEELSQHKLKELEKEHEEIARKTAFEEKQRKKKTKNFIILIVVFAVFILFLYYVKNNYYVSTPYTSSEVHWHTSIDLFVCGEKRDDLNKLGKVQHVGGSLLHTHGDGIAHIEGRILKQEDITLGKFFDNVGLKFSDSQILDKKNGDSCNENPGKVKMLVNGQENTDFRNWVLKDGDAIKIMFE